MAQAPFATPRRLYDIQLQRAEDYANIEPAARVFSTVSHVWGSQEARLLPGIDWAIRLGAGPTYIKLGRLREICLRRNVRYVWWDAYCVDQSQPEEVTIETQNSADFYRQSSWTFALLNDIGYVLLQRLLDPELSTIWNAVVRAGKAGEASTLVGLVSEYRRMPDVAFEAIMGMPGRAPAHEGYDRPQQLSTYAGDLLEIARIVRDICLDTWFNRVWLVQEMKVSPHVRLVGEQADLPLEDFMAAVEGLGIAASYVDLNIGLFGGDSLEMRNLRNSFQKPTPTPLGEALRFTSYRSCTRHEDRLFGIRSLTLQPTAISVHYGPGAVENEINNYFLATGDASFMLFDGPSSRAFPHIPDLINPKFNHGINLWGEPLQGERRLDEHGLFCTFTLYARIVGNIPLQKISNSISMNPERLRAVLRPLTGPRLTGPSDPEYRSAEIALTRAGFLFKGKSSPLLTAELLQRGLLCRLISSVNGNVDYVVMRISRAGVRLAGDAVLLCAGPPGLTSVDTFLILDRNGVSRPGVDEHSFKRVGFARAFDDIPIVVEDTFSGYLI